ncbi:MAG: LabA-like NYN domain-containing protein [Minisyncoccota bacterium]
MLAQFTKGRTAVFIDASNILYSQRTLGWRIDYRKLADYLEKEISLAGLYYYTGKVGSEEKQSAFLKKLERFGYQVVSKEVKFIKSPGALDIPKGNLDVELALDAFRFRESFDTCILFSGDSDFAYLLDLLKREGKQVIVISMRGHIARELIERAKYIPLPRLRGMIERMEKFKGPDKPALEV